MEANRKLTVALVGLGFGSQFIPIYQAHPAVGCLILCDPRKDVLEENGQRFGIQNEFLFTDLGQVLADERIDAVHLVTPIPQHGRQAVQVMQAGKHCACTVPMAISLDEIREIIRVQRQTGLVYFMMETAAYTYQFLQVQQMHRNGEFGRIQFLRGAHYQDMEGWPDYWQGLPPMYYATHAIAPLLLLADSRAVRVHSFGSGTMREDLVQRYGNPYPIETAIFQLAEPALSAEVTRSLFHTTRGYMESFNVYGELASYEWHMEREPQVMFRRGELDDNGFRRMKMTREEPQDAAHLLPAELRKFTEITFRPNEKNPHLSIVQGGAHHGSHPHLVHAFVSSVQEGRPAPIDAIKAANITAAGICAHESAMQGGAAVDIPDFT